MNKRVCHGNSRRKYNEEDVLGFIHEAVSKGDTGQLKKLTRNVFPQVPGAIKTAIDNSHFEAADLINKLGIDTYTEEMLTQDNCKLVDNLIEAGQMTSVYKMLAKNDGETNHLLVERVLSVDTSDEFLFAAIQEQNSRLVMIICKESTITKRCMQKAIEINDEGVLNAMFPPEVTAYDVITILKSMNSLQ